MAFSLRAKQLDVATGDAHVIVLRGRDADAFGILPGDRVSVTWRRKHLIASADISHALLRHGEIGLFREAWRAWGVHDGDPITLEVLSRPPSVEAIRRRLQGKALREQDIQAIISDIASGRLSSIETTYFVAASFLQTSSPRELVWLTRAMASSGDCFRWPGRTVVDKHSVGGLAGNRTTMVVIPIVSALGLTIPKTSSRAITSPAGTADTMEVLAPVTFASSDVRRIVRQTNACLIWGGGLSIAPADDEIIRVSRPLSFEPYDKMLVSIMSKKVAMGVTILVVDMPYGPKTKIPDRRTAEAIRRKFVWLGRQFSMDVTVRLQAAYEPIGRGIGPALEARDVLRVLQQKPQRPLDLEEKSIALAGLLLERAHVVPRGKGGATARRVLTSGRAWRQMQRIIKAQGGNPHIDSDEMTLSAYTKRLHATRSGKVQLDNRAIDDVARTLGAPSHQLAGVYLHCRVGDAVRRGDKLYTLYARSADRLRLAKDLCRRAPPVRIR